ncbi:MAG: molybdopterin biosynthesis protein MoeB [Methanomassiliicoccales archaeon PtaU1.Bin124]|nr:MAG: molybdopterin biosynthesis protein MoeB [Methanomassiliicoccales archaeon PtaU1.Bin124]
MIVQKVRSEGIAHLSYFIGQGADAAVIDPRRDIDEYLELAARNEMNIKLILETHRNEDYVVGSLELAAATGAKILHGGQQFFKYGGEVKDGQELMVGNLRIKALHTPGHTAESFSYVLYDPSSSSSPIMVFTGDALMVNEVGRTDLMGAEAKERAASDLFDSINNKILPLGPQTIICPAHGAGSVCATQIVEREESTLGIEAMSNPMLRLSRPDFISKKLGESLEISPIFRSMEVWNLEGAKVLGRLPSPQPLSPKEIKHAMVKGAFLLDVRQPYSFAGAHIPGATNLYVDFLPVYSGYVITPDRPIALIAEGHCQLEQAVRYLVRQGYDSFAGYLRVGMDLWSKQGNEIATMDMVTAKDLMAMIKRGDDIIILDVRDKRETAKGGIDEAKILHLGEIQSRLAEVPKNKMIVTYCGSGFRGSCAASLLLRNGYSKVANLHGGYAAWQSYLQSSSR